jgi:hypothetical protein
MNERMKWRLLLILCFLPVLSLTHAHADLSDHAGILDGQLQIESASARPAARAYYLLYAAALDQFAADKAALLSSEPVLHRMVRREGERMLGYFQSYATIYTRFSPIVHATREAAALEAFIAKGYRGKLLKDLESYILELRKKAEPKASATPDPK